MRSIADIHITPIGTDQASISHHIAAAEKALRRYPDLEVQIYPMSTTIAGDLDTLFRAIRDMHEAPFQTGAQRVSTTIRIDDRRDGVFENFQERVQAIQSKIGV